METCSLSLSVEFPPDETNTAYPSFWGRNKEFRVMLNQENKREYRRGKTKKGINTRMLKNTNSENCKKKIEGRKRNWCKEVKRTASLKIKRKHYRPRNNRKHQPLLRIVNTLKRNWNHKRNRQEINRKIWIQRENRILLKNETSVSARQEQAGVTKTLFNLLWETEIQNETRKT